MEHSILLTAQSVNIIVRSTRLRHLMFPELVSLVLDGVVMAALGGAMQAGGARLVCQRTPRTLGNKVDLGDPDGIMHTLVVL